MQGDVCMSFYVMYGYLLPQVRLLCSEPLQLCSFQLPALRNILRLDLGHLQQCVMKPGDNEHSSDGKWFSCFWVSTPPRYCGAQVRMMLNCFLLVSSEVYKTSFK